jgi:hypothetical protein
MKRVSILNLLAATLLTSTAMARPHLPMINDNYDKALAQAKQRKLPLFVDVWAPW